MSGEVVAQSISARDIMRAQRNGQGGQLYGSNPYEDTTGTGEGEEGAEQQDTTKKERKIRKPLEEVCSFNFWK
jgi:hypothetical protein